MRTADPPVEYADSERRMRMNMGLMRLFRRMKRVLKRIDFTRLTNRRRIFTIRSVCSWKLIGVHPVFRSGFMQFIMFTKHLEGRDIPGIIRDLKTVGVTGADLCVRPGYPAHPGNIHTALPEAARLFAEEGLSIPLVTAPGDFTSADIDYAERYYQACGAAGVRHVKIGYWNWKPGMDYWEEVKRIRQVLEGFQRLSEKTGVKTVVHNHSGHSMGLNSSSVMNLVRGFDPKHIGVFADVGHLSVCGEPIDMALNIVREHLSVVAFKDLIRTQRVTNSGRVWSVDVVRLGTGFGDWKTALASLRDLKFDGPVSFHSEYGGEPVDTVVDLARADVRFINGIMAAGGPP
jgi:sugar phosphate isomerase/epimerase